MARAYIGLGGNIGDSRQILTDAVVCLAQFPSISITARSCFYISAPVQALGGDYVNNVISVDTDLDPLVLLRLCQSVEQRFGRERPYENAPRTLDIDILMYDNITHNTPELILPHPRITERMFVLLPLLEIDSEIELPNHGKLKDKLPDLSWQKIEKLPNKYCPNSMGSNLSH
ncbi:2-amino-4-hydroxy-6-hydroxymethyldihydropteridine diphosphokinase [Polynucleobacter rarus]|jgi:2-amino-4-hydroxy-6-hydroxymethyldihydropteridine diphosphokinase|uniref:2-amino-4-hydroxy-6- hydroxymethyldihydropteridine diphosphokinase n=1 Tax=Polynucleobacter rarus TaxID=556055 RepID=UPI000D3E517D|nr:2-amino-4-hydroxy-6-hydroxymethyldihydropteridine diphosphokinase [Polynucleobacter rarus]